MNSGQEKGPFAPLLLSLPAPSQQARVLNTNSKPLPFGARSGKERDPPVQLIKEDCFLKGGCSHILFAEWKTTNAWAKRLRS